MDRIKIHFDGACKNQQDFNCPMGLGIAVFINDEYREELSRAILVENHDIDGTSNIGEWLALCEAINIAKDFRKTHQDALIRIYGDSQLIVKQYNMIWSIKDEKFRRYFNIAKSHNVIARVGELIWVPREQNKKADELSKLALLQHKGKRYQIKGRHDESDSEWIEYQSDFIDKVKAKFEAVIDSDILGEASYTIWDQEEEREVSLCTK